MSDSESETNETAVDETGTSSRGEASQPVQTNQGGSDFLTEAEKDTLKEWTIYVTGLFAAAGVALGLNGIIQDQWAHSLISFSGGGGAAGPGAGLQQAFVAAASPHPGNVQTFMMIGIVGVTVLGAVYARNVDNENQTAYKAGAATALVGLPVLLVLSAFLYTIQLDDWDPEFANLIVSGLGAGIAAAVGSAIVIYLTEEQAPDALRP